MKKTTFIFFIFFYLQNIYAQPCDCLAAMEFLQKEYESNLASYQHQVVEMKNQKAYNLHKKNINLDAKNITDKRACIGLVAKYISFFKDEHLGIFYPKGYFPFQDFGDSAAVADYFQYEEKVNFPADTVNFTDNIEGDWYFPNDFISVKVVKNTAAHRDFVGLIRYSKAAQWQRGHIKWEIKKISENKYEIINWQGTRIPLYCIATLQDSVLMLNENQRAYRRKGQTPLRQYQAPENFNFVSLSDSTNYLVLPSFLGEKNHRKTDFFISNYKKNIISKPNLIIDVRGNAGGQDAGYKNLLPILTDTKALIEPTTFAIWASKDNILEAEQNGSEEAEMMQKKPNTFVMYPYDVIDFDTVYPYPKRVAILTDRGCASATEGFLILAKESSKVIQYGTNTMGCFTYASVRNFEVKGLPIRATLGTKRVFFKDDSLYESVGIPPDKPLDMEYYEDWVKIVQAMLEAK